MIDAENIAFAAEAFNAAVTAYAAHEAITREQSIDLAIAERSGDPEAIAAAQAARKAHGNDWHALYVAQQDTADALIRATGVDPRKLASAIKRY